MISIQKSSIAKTCQPGLLFILMAHPEMDTCIKVMEKKYFNAKMDRMIEQQIFALEMDALTNRLQRLQLDKKIVTLLNELWDKMNE